MVELMSWIILILIIIGLIQSYYMSRKKYKEIINAFDNEKDLFYNQKVINKKNGWVIDERNNLFVHQIQGIYFKIDINNTKIAR